MWTLVLSSLSVVWHDSAFGIFEIGIIPVDIDSCVTASIIVLQSSIHIL
jgi:hypothetical protein